VRPDSETLQRKPVIPERLRLFWNTYSELSSSRAVSNNGDSAIPVSEIEAYCNLQGFRDPLDRNELFLLIRAMDEEFLAHMRELRKQQNGSSNGKARS
jgi:hypothetical protein